MALIDRQVEYILSDHIFIVHSVDDTRANHAVIKTESD